MQQAVTEARQDQPEATPEPGIQPAQPEDGSQTDAAADGGGLVLEVEVGHYLPDAIRPAWQALEDYPLVLVIVLLAAGFAIGKLLQIMVHGLFGRLADRTQSGLDNQILGYLAAPILQTMVTLAATLAVLVLGMPESVERLLVRLLFSLLVLLWGRAWFRATHSILAVLESNQDKFRVFQPRTVPLFEMSIKLVLVGLFVYLLFAIWGIDATAWIASAGIIGIAIGFAAKDTLANLISGVSIVADAPYKIGDYIVLDTGERGIVTNLGMRSTRLLTRDDVEISIPNAVIGAAKITNESGGPWIKQRVRVPVGVAYGTDTAKVVSVLQAIAEANPDVVDTPEPRVRMRGFGDSSLNFDLLGWIDKPEARGMVVHQLLMEIDRRFREEGIVIPFPQRDLHIRSNPDSPGDG